MTQHAVIICDVCGARAPWGVTPFATELPDPVTGKLVRFTWDVGACCIDRPFRVRQHRKVEVTVMVLAE